VPYIRSLLAFLLVSLPIPPASSLWDKPAEQWNLADTYKILRESPWSGGDTKFEAVYTQRHTDRLTSITTDSPTNTADTPLIRGIELSRKKPLPEVSVLWWSSKAIRLARLRLLQLKKPTSVNELLRVEPLSDYVVAVEGGEPLRILQDTREDLHDTVFLELEGGLTLDFTKVEFVQASDDYDARAEFHFPRELNGHAAIDSKLETIVLHCRATAKTERPGRQNALAFRTQFHPRAMRVLGQPDL
jgi:hypothetical protein